jgi:glycosyltransferase involved in cell wall biosynthesis
MNVTLILEYGGRMRWQQPGAWAALITRAMQDRGHRVRVVADCLADPALIEADEIVVRAPARKRLERRPRRFQRWALAHTQSPSISLSSVVPANVWCPLDSSWRDEIVWLTNLRNPATLAMEVVHRLWVPPLALAQARARALALAIPARLVTLGASTEASVLPLGFASWLSPTAASASHRQQVRRALGIAPEAFVVLTSAAHTDRAGLGALLDGWRLFCQTSPGVLLLMGRKAALIDRHCRARGVSDTTCVLGQVERPELVFAAADVAAAWSARRDVNATGRFVADALAMQLPVLSTQAASGAELLRTQPDAGGLLNEASALAWMRALANASKRDWRVSARASAAALAPMLDPARLAAVIEKMLLETAPDTTRLR